MYKDSKQKKMFIKYPNITVEQTYCILWAILNNEKTKQWLYNFFIQIVGFKHYKSGYLLFDESSLNFETCPFVDYQVIDRNLFNKISLNKDKSSIFKELIDNDCYIYLMLNQFYNPNNIEFYKKTNFAHYTLIYGYNIDKQTFNIADFYNYKKYDMSKEISFKNLDIAFDIDDCINEDWLKYKSSRIKYELGSSIAILKYIDEDYDMDIKILKNLLLDYIGSTNSIQRIEEKTESLNRGCIYGINNYKYMINAIRFIINEKRYTWNTVKAFNLILDHKKVMILMLNQLHKKISLEKFKFYSLEYNKLKTYSSKMLSLFLKYNLKKDTSILEKIIILLEKLFTEEKKVLEMLIEEISELEENSKYYEKFKSLEINRFTKEVL